MGMYGMAQPTKAGHWLCTKCNTWNREYTNATKEVVCPWCSAPKGTGTKETAKGGKPTEVDLELFKFLKGANKEQIARISNKFNINVEIFTYMKTALLADKKKIMAFVEDELQ